MIVWNLYAYKTNEHHGQQSKQNVKTTLWKQLYQFDIQIITHFQVNS